LASPCERDAQAFDDSRERAIGANPARGSGHGGGRVAVVSGRGRGSHGRDAAGMRCGGAARRDSRESHGASVGTCAFSTMNQTRLHGIATSAQEAARARRPRAWPGRAARQSA